MADFCRLWQIYSNFLSHGQVTWYVGSPMLTMWKKNLPWPTKNKLQAMADFCMPFCSLIFSPFCSFWYKNKPRPYLVYYHLWFYSCFISIFKYNLKHKLNSSLIKKTTSRSSVLTLRRKWYILWKWYIQSSKYIFFSDLTQVLMFFAVVMAEAFDSFKFGVVNQGLTEVPSDHIPRDTRIITLSRNRITRIRSHAFLHMNDLKET